MPHESVFDAVERLHEELEEVKEILTGKETSVRLVLTPENVVVAEARRSLTTLSLFGYQVDGVVANRVFPADGADEWRAGWVAAQADVLAAVDQSFSGLPVWRSAYRTSEPVGLEELSAFAAAAYGDDDPLAVPTGEPPVSVRRTPDGTALRLALPFADKGDIDLGRHGDELVVTVGSYRRVLVLPAALRQQQVVGAGLEGGALTVRFAPTEEVEQ
jgi:arsenite-transporting ATPase